MNDDINRILGDHGAQLRSLTRAVDGIAQDVKTLIAEKNTREGGRKAFYTIAAGIGTAAGAIGSALGSIFK